VLFDRHGVGWTCRLSFALRVRVRPFHRSVVPLRRKSYEEDERGVAWGGSDPLARSVLGGFLSGSVLARSLRFGCWFLWRLRSGSMESAFRKQRGLGVGLLGRVGLLSVGVCVRVEPCGGWRRCCGGGVGRDWVLGKD